jgi:hypothetical protein
MDFLSKLPLDVVFFILLGAIHIGAWIAESRKLAESPLDEADARTLGATTLTSASTAGITAVSILIPASFVIVQLASKTGGTATSIPHAASYNVFVASVWFLFSLFCGLFFVISQIPMRALKHNVARDLRIGIPFGGQLLALFFGMVRLLFGLYYIMYS